MPDPVYKYTFTPADGSSAVSWQDETSSEETGIGKRVAEYEFSGIDGVEEIVLGDSARALALTAWLHAASGSALRTLMDAVDALRGKVGTLTVRGGEDSWTNVVIRGEPKYGRRYPPQADGSVGCQMQLVFRQLVPG